MQSSTHRWSRSTLTMVVGAALAACPVGVVHAAEEAPGAAPTAATPPTTNPTTRPAPKEISEQVNKGLAWLAKHQREDGGWDQGEVANDGLRGGEPGESNIADTCMAALAFIRAGHTPTSGDHAAVVRKALDFVCTHVEKATQEGLSITDIRTTRLQSKLGPHIDTFTAALLLAEVKDKTQDEASRKRVVAALDKVMDRIEKNQNEDGRWVKADEGWAAVLCNSVANKAVNRAAARGQAVSGQVLARAQKAAAADFDKATGGVTGEGSAGVELYARAANLQAFQDAAVANAPREEELRGRREKATQQMAQAQQKLAELESAGPAAATPAATRPVEKQLAEAQKELASADEELVVIRENESNLKAAQQKVVERMEDKQFVAGFGNNGGEEFLSHMNIGEGLLLKGGEEFARWDKAMTENLNRIQNEDGSWSGHHCITGRTFCTSAALLTLTVDRSAPDAAAAK